MEIENEPERSVRSSSDSSEWCVIHESPKTIHTKSYFAMREHLRVHKILNIGGF
jgi:hypothetical protein